MLSPKASIILGLLLVAVVWAGNGGLFGREWYYWSTIVVVRTAGTAIGDFLAGRQFFLGLPMSTFCTGLVFVATLLIWKDHISRRLAKG